MKINLALRNAFLAMAALALFGAASANAATAMPPASATAPAPATAQSASAVVRGFYAQLTSTLKQGAKLGFAGRYKKLEPAIRAAFDLPLMTKMSVGASWDSASLQEKAALVAAFSDFSIATYASRFAQDDGETFTVKGEKASPSGGMMVDTVLKPKDGDPVSLDYLLKPDDKGQYRIVDVFMDGTISELATRRAEFSSIARREGIAALVNSLDQKSKQMGPS
ncbi:MAG: ABC transporter substrate-binding protein [Alphaproteobacteria bacterium]|nr:ABC transporter substrate-binding protein [Alphaproteobacteria bacterium]